MRRRLEQIETPIRLNHCALDPLARTAYMACRARPPERVVETGVAYGMTTNYLLAAITANGEGRVDSIDLPPLSGESGDHVGALVDPALHSRWVLHRGNTRRVLPKLLAQAGTIDVFVHDSLHTYRTMRWEFETAWRHLSPGGLLLSDDIQGNEAFLDFAQKAQPRSSWTVRDPTNGCFGVLVK